MYKMVQSSHWAIQLVLLCQLWQLGTPCFGRDEHSSVGVYQEEKIISEEDVGDIILFGIFVIIGKIGKKLETEVSHVDTLKYVKKVLAYNP